MTLLKRTWPLFILLSAVLCVPSTATAAKASKIVLQDSTVYENVVYLTDNVYKVITLTEGTSKKTISYADVVAIYDEFGDDVTEDKLGSVHAKTAVKPSPVPAVSPPDMGALKPTVPPAATPPAPAAPESGTTARAIAPRYPWKIAVRTAANFSIPASDFYDGFRSGFGYEGDLLIPAGRNFAVRLSVSRSGIRDDPERLIELTYPGYQLVSDNQTATAMRFVIAAEYYEWPRWRKDGRWMYYIYTGAGAINHTLSGRLTIRDPGSGTLYDLISSGKDLTRFMWNIGGGATVKIAKSIGLDGSGEFDFIAIGTNRESYSAYGAVEYAYLFDVKVGLVWLF